MSADHTRFVHFFLTLLILVTAGCAVVEGVTEVAWETTKFTGKVAGKAVKGAVHIAQGKQTVRLKRIGNSYFCDAVLNKKTHATLMVDTGATNVMLSSRMAQKLGLNLQASRRVKAKLAGGRMVAARVVTLKELRIGKATAYNIPVIVLEQEVREAYDGLLGMSFLNQFIFQIDTHKNELILQKRN